MRRTILKHKIEILIGILLFTWVTAGAGGLALMAGIIDQPQWLEHTDFTSLFTPGLMLFGIVGGSALVACLASWRRLEGWRIINVLSAVIMLLWIVGEIVSIRTFHFLQIIYIVTSLAVLWLTLQPQE